MDPGAVLLALLGSPNLSSRRLVYEQYDSTVGADTVAGPGRGAAVLRVKGTTQGPRRLDRRRTRPSACSTRGSGAALSVAEADPQRVDHRRPAARRDQLPQLRRPDPAGGVLAAAARASAGWATPAARWACRSPAATSRSTTNRPAGPSPRPPRSAWSGCSTTWRRWSGRPSGRRRRDRPVGDSTPGLAGSAYALLAGDAARGRRAEPRPRPRGGAPGVHPRGDRPRARGVRPGRLGRRAGGGPRRMRDVGRPWGAGSARASSARRRWRCSARAPPASSSPAGRAPRAGPGAARSPARAAGRTGRCRSAANAWSSNSPAPARRARPRNAGAGSPTRSRSRSADLRHAWEHGLARALGWEG